MRLKDKIIVTITDINGSRNYLLSQVLKKNGTTLPHGGVEQEYQIGGTMMLNLNSQKSIGYLILVQ